MIFVVRKQKEKKTKQKLFCNLCFFFASNIYGVITTAEAVSRGAEDPYTEHSGASTVPTYRCKFGPEPCWNRDAGTCPPESASDVGYDILRFKELIRNFAAKKTGSRHF